MKLDKQRRSSLAFSGGVFITFAVGAASSIELVKYGFFILLAATLLVFHYISTSIMDGGKKKTSSVMGITGSLLLFLFVGIQSPHVPFRPVIITVGVALLLPYIFSKIQLSKK